MELHLYKRPVEKNGKKVTVWYYWYYGLDKKRIRKSTGCSVKKEAEAFLARLEKEQTVDSTVKIKDIVNDMFFSETSTYHKLEAARGTKYTEMTVYYKKRYANIILEKYADCTPSSLDVTEIEKWVINLKYSNSTKNRIISTLTNILKECHKRKLITYVPDIQKFVYNYKKKDIFTVDEINRLFPEDYEQLTDRWTSGYKKDYYVGIDGKVHKYGFMFGVIFYLQLCTGLREGEVVAIGLQQVKEKGLFVNRMLDAKNQLQPFLKKGNEQNTKSRVVIFPERMIKLMNEYMKIRPVCEDFIFSFNGHTIDKVLLDRRFRIGLCKSGICESVKVKNYCRKIDHKGRILTPHSLRYTYNTYMRNYQFQGDVLREMIGHCSQSMTDYYTRDNLEVEYQGLLQYQNQINDIWK